MRCLSTWVACLSSWFDCAYVVAFFLLNSSNLIFSMKTVIYVLAGAIALSSVGCTAGRKERQAKAEPASGAKAVAKTRTSARAVLNSSAKPVDSKRVATKEPVASKPSAPANKPTQTLAKKDSKAEVSGAAKKPPVVKASTKSASKPDSKRTSSGADVSAAGGLSFNSTAVEAVSPLPRTASPSSGVVVPPKLVRVSSLTETPDSAAPEKPAKTEAPKPETVAQSAPKASKEAVQAELNKALADAGSDARAVVGSLVPTATPDSPKATEKSSVVEDDAPSTSDPSAVVKSPATMKGSDAGAPPAVVDSKGEVKEASAAPVVAAAATSKGLDSATEPKPSAPEAAALPGTPAVEPVAAVVPVAPKKPASALEKKEIIASALRDGNEALRSEDSSRALELFESVVKQDKDQRDAWFRIGYLKEMSGDIQGAIKAFREVKRIMAN
ncbi:MAG: hypothetical protein RIS92_2306 [Verrucomicrobiota bacterium]